MMSSDHEILLDIQGSIYRLNTRLERVENDVADLKTGLQETNARLGRVENSVEKLILTVQHLDERLSARIDDLHTFFYYGLVIIGVLIAFTTFVITSFSFMRREHTEKPESERVQRDTGLSRLEVVQIMRDYGLIQERRG